MHIDRYPDIIHKKIQRANPILSMYSVRVKLPHIPKKDVYMVRRAATECFAQEGQLFTLWEGAPQPQ